ncbi:MAG TPA: alpha/beta fold hydrolase [Steroidobacteraceae bacterium]|nr:alpha/beta fold hydrolase [Steroidobacteraceae bacterium]
MRTVLPTLLTSLIIVAVGYALICVLLYFGQESSIFFPRPNDPQLRQRYAAERFEIAAPGATLEGWWLENPQATTPAVVLYFGGNAEDVLYTASQAANIDARAVVLVNYRGYGGSTGKPGQQALYDDGLAIYDYAIKRGVQPEHIVVMGRSLGSGVAAMLAGARPVRAAILITPFDSLESVAAGHYPFLPVRLLLRHPFPSKDWARRTNAAALIIAAERDSVVPAAHARKLCDEWAGKKRLHVLPHTGHNDIEMHPDYYRLINEFLAAER